MTRSVPALLAEVETLPEEWALVLLDRALASGECRPSELVAHARNFPERVRWLVVIADAHAITTTHSLLRRAWYAADLPTPVVGRRLLTPQGVVRTICATEYHRFAVSTDAAEDAVTWLARVGWRVLVLNEEKVHDASTSALSKHLRAEHLEHLATVGLGGHRPRAQADRLVPRRARRSRR
ncbi:MAG: hypothetical protein ACTHJM_11130 [Marmoricola sp.]